MISQLFLTVRFFISLFYTTVRSRMIELEFCLRSSSAPRLCSVKFVRQSQFDTRQSVKRAGPPTSFRDPAGAQKAPVGAGNAMRQRYYFPNGKRKRQARDDSFTFY